MRVIQAYGALPTYRIPFSLATAIGLMLELYNPTASAMVARIRRYRFYMAVATTFTFNRYSSASSGGTPSNRTPTRMDRGQSASLFVGSGALSRWHTSAPTPGTLVETVDYHWVPTSFTEDGTLENDRVPMTIRPGEYFGIVVAAATNCRGMLEWTEEPV